MELCWFNTSDGFCTSMRRWHRLSLLLILGRADRPGFPLGHLPFAFDDLRGFLGFQWDTLLLKPVSHDLSGACNGCRNFPWNRRV
jgi:hypothetical protein